MLLPDHLYHRQQKMLAAAEALGSSDAWQLRLSILHKRRRDLFKNAITMLCLILLMIASGLLHTRSNGGFSAAVRAQASTWQYHQDNTNTTHEIPNDCIYNEDIECHFNDFVTICGCHSYLYTNFGNGWTLALDRHFRFASSYDNNNNKNINNNNGGRRGHVWTRIPGHGWQGPTLDTGCDWHDDE
jgi:hypothetical protein